MAWQYLVLDGISDWTPCVSRDAIKRIRRLYGPYAESTARLARKSGKPVSVCYTNRYHGESEDKSSVLIRHNVLLRYNRA